jgi:hypothetical protein
MILLPLPSRNRGTARHPELLDVTRSQLNRCKGRPPAWRFLGIRSSVGRRPPLLSFVVCTSFTIRRSVEKSPQPSFQTPRPGDKTFNCRPVLSAIIYCGGISFLLDHLVSRVARPTHIRDTREHHARPQV